MTITVTLPEETERRLRQRAAARGMDVDGYVRTVLEKEVLSFDELLAPLRRQFAESGMTDDELGQLIEECRDEVHQERRARRPQ